MKNLVRFGAILPVAGAAVFGLSSSAEAAFFFNDGDSTAVSGGDQAIGLIQPGPANVFLACDGTLVGAVVNVGLTVPTTQNCTAPVNDASGSLNTNTANTLFATGLASNGGFTPLRNASTIGSSSLIPPASRIKSIDFNNSATDVVNNWIFGVGTFGNAANVYSFFQFDVAEKAFGFTIDAINDTVTFTALGNVTRTDVFWNGVGTTPQFTAAGEIALNSGTVTGTESVNYSLVFTTQDVLPFQPNVGSSAAQIPVLGPFSSYSFALEVVNVPEPSSVISFLGLGLLGAAGAINRKLGKK